jgi:Fe-S cluster assembly protein SufD
MAEGARLDHFRIVRARAAAQLAHHIDVRLAERARYAQRLLATGAAYNLQRTLLDLHGRAAEASARGVLLAAGTVLEQQVRSRHAAASTRSDVEMLALASGAARIVGNAYTAIAAGCDGADVRQRLAGIPTAGQPKLVLRPHLEIHHDNVQAAHGATWGALPGDALFHARQRGLDEAAAKAMILEGLARAVLSRGAELPLDFDAALAAAVSEHLRPAKERSHG